MKKKQSTIMKLTVMIAVMSFNIMLTSSCKDEDYVFVLPEYTWDQTDTSEKAPSVSISIGGVSFKMIEVEGGSFTMGATLYRDGLDESPTHRVTLSTYYIGETEVTQELWEAVMGSNPSLYNGQKRPVEQVDWNDCQVFINKLNALTGRQFRLPTEAEWEFAARDGNKRRLNRKYSGSGILDYVAWYGGNSNGQTQEVAQRKSNELGIYDMSGNVREWCQDWYGEYDNSEQTNPTGPVSGIYRVNRGGSWLDTADDCRFRYRFYDKPSFSSPQVGLRLAL